MARWWYIRLYFLKATNHICESSKFAWKFSWSSARGWWRGGRVEEGVLLRWWCWCCEFPGRGMKRVPRLMVPRSFRRKWVGAGKGSGSPWLGPGSETNIFGRQASRSSTKFRKISLVPWNISFHALMQLFLNFSTRASFPLQSILEQVILQVGKRYILIICIAHLQNLFAGEHIPESTTSDLDREDSQNTNHFTPSLVVANFKRSSTPMKLTNAYPTLHPDQLWVNCGQTLRKI